MESLGRMLVILGLTLAAAGILVIYSPRVPYLGKLPGDIRIERENFSFYFPLTTCILLSLMVSAILWILRKK